MWLFLLLLWSSPALAVPITYDFTGATAIGTVTGTWTVDEAVVIGTDAHSLIGNTLHPVSGWSFLATSSYAAIPTTTFGLPGDTLEYCVGYCVFGLRETVTTVRAFSTTGTMLHVALNGSPPTTMRTSSYYRVVDGTIAFLNSGSVSTSASATITSVPEPSNFWWIIGTAAALYLLRKH